MNELDQELREDALDAVMEVCDETIIYRRFFKGEYDVATSRTVAPPPEEFAIYALKDSFSYQTLGAGMGGDSVIEASDILVSVPAVQLDFTPEAMDELDFDGATWVIKGKRA